MTVEEVLVQARKLLEPGFAQGVLVAGGPYGEPLLYCARGAIFQAIEPRAFGRKLWRAQGPLAADAEWALLHGWDVPAWNNVPGRTHAEILAAFDAAIERVRLADPAHEAVLVA